MGFKLQTAVLGAILALGVAILPLAAQAVTPQNIPNGEIRLGEGGYVRVSAIGLPPFGASDGASAREVARQNAMGLAQRRLLGALLDLPTGPNKPTVRDRLAARPQYRERLRELIARAHVSGQELADGSAEVTLELPYSGSGGVAEFFAAISP